MVFADPLPTEEELSAFYQGFAYAMPEAEEVERRRAYTAAGTERFVKVLRCLAPKSKRVLDYGGGLGFFSDALADHFESVTHFDLDSQAREFARSQQRGGFFVAENSEEALSQQYDVILLNQVIEHVPEPVEFLRSFGSALVQGGVLIVTTPNNKSSEQWYRPDLLWHYASSVKMPASEAVRKLATDNWLCCDPPRHLYAFSPNNLDMLLMRAGFRSVRSETAYFHEDPFGQPSYRWKGIGSPKRAAWSLLYLISLITAPNARRFDRERKRGSTLIGYYAAERQDV